MWDPEEDAEMLVLEDYEWEGEEDLAFWDLPYAKIQLIFGASEMCMAEDGRWLCWLQPKGCDRGQHLVNPR